MTTSSSIAVHVYRRRSECQSRRHERALTRRPEGVHHRAEHVERRRRREWSLGELLSPDLCVNMSSWCEYEDFEYEDFETATPSKSRPGPLHTRCGAQGPPPGSPGTKPPPLASPTVTTRPTPKSTQPLTARPPLTGRTHAISKTPVRHRSATAHSHSQLLCV